MPPVLNLPDHPFTRHGKIRQVSHFPRYNLPGFAEEVVWLLTGFENGMMNAPVTWNFQKFIIDEDGRLVGVVKPKTEPDTPEILDCLKK